MEFKKKYFKQLFLLVLLVGVVISISYISNNLDLLSPKWLAVRSTIRTEELWDKQNIDQGGTTRPHQGDSAQFPQGNSPQHQRENSPKTFQRNSGRLNKGGFAPVQKGNSPHPPPPPRRQEPSSPSNHQRGSSTSSSQHLQKQKNTAARFPHEHVYYLKTHKTGSSTMYAILADFCRTHELVPLLPRGPHINQGGRLLEKQLMLVDSYKTYDMIFSHHVYSPLVMNYLHNDTYRITSLREPFSNFVSAFLYYRNKYHVGYLSQVRTNDPLTEFLRRPEKYERNGYYSYTNNRQSMDMGYDLSKGWNNTQYIKQFIQESDSRFDLVLIMEYFDEGLVIMKRVLRWNTEDIVYFAKNKGSYKKNRSNNNASLEREQRKLHARFSQADISLYKYFLKRFEERMRTEIGLKEEVTEFRKILVQFAEYCDNVGESNKKLTIPQGKWNNPFQISRLKCILLSFDYFQLTDFLKERQHSIFMLNPLSPPAPKH